MPKRLSRLTYLLPSLFLAAALPGCVTTGADTAATPESAPESVTPAPAPEEEALADALVVVEPPGFCEQLLENLNAARPLLEGLDDALSGHSARMENLLAELEKPAPEPSPIECPDDPDSQLGTMEVIGTIEWIYMNPPGDHYQARVDSGAETSSLSAREISEFERDGDDWVRFTFEHEAAEKSVEIEQPILRTIIVRQPGLEEEDRRVVVELDIRLGDRLQRTEFALTDRSRMTYPVLLGRAFLRDLYVIDVARTYTLPRYEAP